MNKWGLSQECSLCSTFEKSVTLTHHIITIKDNNNYVTILIDAEKAFNKMHPPHSWQKLSKLRIEENFLILIRDINKRLTISIILIIYGKNIDLKIEKKRQG